MAYTTVPALNKHAKFLFAVQADEGTQASSGFTAVPFSGTLDFELQGNLTEFRQSDGSEYMHLMYSSGAWYEGSAPVVVSPGMGAMTNLMNWIFNRDASNNQADFATCYVIDDVGVRSAVDVKVSECTITLRKGEPVTFALTLIGKGAADDTEPGTYNMDTGGPYLFSDVTIKTADYNSSTVADDNFESMELRIDGGVDDGADGLRLTNSVNPVRLYNTTAIQMTGSFERDYITGEDGGQAYIDGLKSAVNNPFSTTGDLAVDIILSRNANELQFNMPRLKVTEVSQPIEGSDEGRQVQNVSFRALASDPDGDGTFDAPIDYQYTAGGS